MRRNRIVPILLVGSLLTLSGCSLFNDDDLKISNSFIAPSSETSFNADAVMAGGVEGTRVDAVPNAYCFKNIGYAKDGVITNGYKDIELNHNTYHVNGGNDYTGLTRTSNNFDLYVPDSAAKNADNTVILFIHGGAWVSGFKTDVNPYVYDFANRGYITATIKYTLLKKSMDDPSLSIFRNLDEIDACITAIKSALGDLKYDLSKLKLVVGGASSGSHLAMLYSYSRGETSAIPIKFIVNAVGPVDIKPDAWKGFVDANDTVLDAGLSASAIAAQASASNLAELRIAGDTNNWNEYQTMRIANGMCGLPHSLEEVEASANAEKTSIETPNEASLAMTNDGGEDLLSVTTWIDDNDFPIICAYAGKDSVVGINQYATLEAVLDAKHVKHDVNTEGYFYFRNSGHTDISKTADETNYNAFVNKVDDWCKTL